MDPLASVLLAILLMIVSAAISTYATWYFARRRAIKDMLEEGTIAIGEIEAIAQNTQDLEQALDRKRDEIQELDGENTDQFKQVFCEMLDGHRLAARSLIESVDALKIRWEVRAEITAPGGMGPTQVYEIFRKRMEASREVRRQRSRDFRAATLVEQLRESTERSKTVVRGVERSAPPEAPESMPGPAVLDSTNPSELLMYSMALDRQGKLDDALAAAEKAYSLAPTQPNVVYGYASRLINSDQASVAKDIFEKWFKEGEARAIDYVEYARALRELGDADAALQACDRAIELDPEDGLPHHAKANILHMREAWDDALESQNKAIECERDEPIYHYNAGVILYRLERFNEALVEFSQATALDDSQGDYWYGKAYTHSLVGETDEALKALERSISLDVAKKMQAVLDDDFDSVREHRRFKELTRLVPER